MIVRKMNRHVIRRSAFTLLEILVVVAIIVVLAGVGGMVMLPQLEKSKERTALTQVKGTLSTAVQTFYLNEGRFPNSLDELAAPTNNSKPYIERDALLDPWGHPYGYDASGPRNSNNKPDIWANAPNGKQIGNWPGGGN